MRSPFGSRRWSKFCSSVVLLTSHLAFAQSLAIGLKFGGRITNDISTPLNSATSESKRYIAGPMLELGLSFGLSVEVDALYQRQGYRTSFGSFAGGYSDRERANAWEVPVVGKYRLPFPAMKPYVEAGFAARTMNGSIDSNGYTVDYYTGQVTYSRGHSATNWSNSVGVVAGGGVQFGLGPMRLAPEVRYTHWSNTPIDRQGPYGYSFQSAQNEVTVLVGVSWKVH